MVPSLRTTPTAHLLALASIPRYSCALPCCPWRLMQTDAARAGECLACHISASALSERVVLPLPPGVAAVVGHLHALAPHLLLLFEDPLLALLMRVTLPTSPKHRPVPLPPPSTSLGRPPAPAGDVHRRLRVTHVASASGVMAWAWATPPKCKAPRTSPPSPSPSICRGMVPSLGPAMRTRKYFLARVLFGKSTTRPPEKPTRRADDVISSACSGPLGYSCSTARAPRTRQRYSVLKKRCGGDQEHVCQR